MKVRVVVKLAWWWRPYSALTRLALWLGLPVDMDVVEADIRRAVRVKIYEQ